MLSTNQRRTRMNEYRHSYTALRNKKRDWLYRFVESNFYTTIMLIVILAFIAAFALSAVKSLEGLQ